MPVPLLLPGIVLGLDSCGTYNGFRNRNYPPVTHACFGANQGGGVRWCGGKAGVVCWWGGAKSALMRRKLGEERNPIRFARYELGRGADLNIHAGYHGWIHDVTLRAK